MNLIIHTHLCMIFLLLLYMLLFLHIHTQVYLHKLIDYTRTTLNIHYADILHILFCAHIELINRHVQNT